MRALFLDERSFASRPHLERPLPPQRQALLVAGVETRLQETRRSPLHLRAQTSRRRRRLRLLAVRCSGLKSLNVGAPHIDVGFFRSYAHAPSRHFIIDKVTGLFHRSDLPTFNRSEERR